MKTKICSSALSLICFLSTGTQSFANTELKASNWHFPELTYAEKQELVDSVKTVFNDFYVHRSQKKTEYNYDSQAEANKLSVDMSSETLLRSVSAIFMNVKDLHTGFRYPVPASCFIGGFPLKVNLAYENGDNSFNLKEKLVIQAKLSNQLTSKMSNAEDKKNFASLAPGDEILAISNLGLENESQAELSANDAIKKLESVARGANDDAAKTRAVQILFSRNGASMKPPSGRFDLTIKRAADNQIVSYSFPWLAYTSSDPACESYDSKTNITQPNHKTFRNVSAQIHAKDFLYNETFEDAYVRTTVSGNVTTKILELDGAKKFALIQMNRFVPFGIETTANYLDARVKIKEEVDGIRTFILANKDQIDGVIFDVRGNGGGYGSFPQIIANMFTTEFVSNMSVQPLVSKTNRDVFHNLEFSRYFTRLGTNDPLVDKNNNVLTAPISETANEMDYFLSYLGTGDAEIILSPAPRFDEDENDELSPEYTADYKRFDTVAGKPGKFALKEIFTNKPVAVLTNSNCYSACDIFVSIMKDYNIAKIIGETGHTGGGGANVVEWNSFAKPYLLDAQGTRGPVIPNAKELPKESTMRFAWNRIVRERAQDQASERYIEGPGVIVAQENIYRPTMKDVLDNSSDLFKKIMTDMVTNRDSYNTNR